MSDTEEKSPLPQRRGLGSPSIQRGAIARIAIRSVRLARAIAWQLLDIVLAAIIIFEEWGWRPLSAALARLAEFNAVARLEMEVRSLSPWPALAVFLVPSVLFLPLKLMALWLIAGGHAVGAMFLFAFAKVAGTALYARIFQLTQPALMQLGWFASLYNWFMPWKAAIVAHARQTKAWQAGVAMKHRVKTATKAAWVRLKPVAIAALERVRSLLQGRA